MTSRYIIVEDGMPHVADSLPGDVRRVNYLWIVERGWRNQWAFNNDSRYQLEVPNPPAIGRFSKILAHTIYNPAVEVQTEWNQTGEYLKGDVIELVRSGLETDDGISCR